MRTSQLYSLRHRLTRPMRVVWSTSVLLLCAVMLVQACSTTDKIPEGEQLYTGIKSITYDLPTAKSKQRRNSKAVADSAGVITSIANAVEAIDRAVNGGQKHSVSMAELEKRDPSSLTTAERKMIEHKEADAKANLAAMRTEVEAVLAYPPNGALFGSSTFTSP